MKRIILTALAAALTLGSFTAYAGGDDAEKAAKKAAKEELKAFNKALKEAKKASEGTTPDFAAARAAIATAQANSNSKDNPEFYFAAGEVEYAQMNNERNKPALGGKMDEKTIYDCTDAAYDYYTKAYELYKAQDPKAKNLETAKAHAFECYQITGGLRANAGYWYNAKDWKKAYAAFSKSIEATQSDLIKEGAAQNPILQETVYAPLAADSTINQTMFNRAVVAIYSEDHNLAITALEAMKDKNYETNLIYQSLAKEYLALQDTAKFVDLLKDGVQKMPEEPWYATSLMNVYLEQKNYAEAANYIDNIIKSDPNNARFVDLKGRLLEMQGDNAAAEECYKKATELDATNYQSWSNLGRIAFNRATDKENELYDKKKYDSVDKEAGPLYDAALPYYEKAFAFDSERSDNTIANAMRTILYKKFQKPSCPNKKELIEQYNEVSRAYGLPEFKK